MTRVIKLFFLLLFCTFLVTAFAADPKDLGKLVAANWNCDLDHLKYGEIELIIEELEKENPHHPAICIYSNFQNSILWRSKEYQQFDVQLVPVDEDSKNAGSPFNIDFVKTPVKSVGQLLSSGPPKSGLPHDKVFKYGVTITYFDDAGNKKIIDPHISSHGGI